MLNPGLSHAAERLITPWLPIIQPSKRQVPQLVVHLTAVGGELRSVRAEVVPLTPEYLARHQRLVAEFEEPQNWPKHLVVEYRWHKFDAEDAASGVFVLLTTSAPPTML
jgi:hypothetical protein